MQSTYIPTIQCTHCIRNANFWLTQLARRHDALNSQVERDSGVKKRDGCIRERDREKERERGRERGGEREKKEERD